MLPVLFAVPGVNWFGIFAGRPVTLAQVPLLALFGSLQPEDYVARNSTAIAAAKERAMRNLQRCVVASTDDMAASAELVAYVVPPLL